MNGDAANEPTISISDACAIVGVSRRTIYNWLSAGKLRYRRTAGGGVRIFRASLFVDGDANKRDMSERFGKRSAEGQ